MASAILTRGNGPRSSGYISNFTNTNNNNNNNNNLNFKRFHNIQNPNPNPNCRHFFVGTTGDVRYRFQTHQHLPSPINSVPASSGYRYITFRLNSYTTTELKQLKNRLLSDLQRVRILRQRLLELPAPVERTDPLAVSRKRTNSLPPAKFTKKQCARSRTTVAVRRKTMMRECGQILGKLMMHKHGWVFNTPVDAVALKLFDYHNIINNPMDLGTIKSKLARNEYKSPLSFASDVRLTFHNAMVYNGHGSNVFVMAERLLLLFESMFNSPVKKPEARVSKKPEMTDNEKAELAESLWSLKLGREGMDQILLIVKKGVLGLEEHQGDELELDLAVLDNDTLWELHGYVARKCTRTEVVNNNMICSVGDEEDVVENAKDGANVISSESSSDSGSSSSGDSGCND